MSYSHLPNALSAIDRRMEERPDLRAPGVPAHPSDRQRAVAVARRVIADDGMSGDDITLLARELLRALALAA